ncbi:BQ2448_5901 [Microbotryum intermedium]|uniref:BQ2448_5901 protein n=1 Tax=Microbotryum intermedium TaxID=269621 RepID=A0A238F2M5_9BASI|nr:BQ2448_5901 [Microbotryum intermedium]
MTAVQTRPAPPVHDQWKDAQRRGFCIWSPPSETSVLGNMTASIGAPLGPSVAAITTQERVGPAGPLGAAAAASTSTSMGDTFARGETMRSDFKVDDDLTSRVKSISISTHPSVSPYPGPSAEASPRTKTTLTSLPTEILSQIISLAILNIPSYQLARHLERYSLINRTFSTLAQANLFRRVSLMGEEAVVVLGEGDGEWGMDELEEVLKRCKALKELTLRHVRLDLGRFDLACITSLELVRVNLENSSATSLPRLRDLTIQDVTHVSEQPFHNLLPLLRSLRFNYEQASTSPLLFQQLIPCITSIEALEVERLYPATEFVDYLLPPSPSVKRGTSPLLAWSSSSSEGMAAGTSLSPSTMVEDEDEDAASSTPSLGRLTRLKNLILWSDSSHRANSSFPLLETLPNHHGAPALEELVVRVDWGYRDRAQEIHAMENELCARIEEEESKLGGGGLKRLVLPKEFRGRVERLGNVSDNVGVELIFA